MARLPDSYIEDIKARVPIVDIASQYTDLKPVNGNKMIGCCPLHDEKTPSFRVDSDRNNYYCFGCGASGSSIDLVMEKRGLGFLDAIDWAVKQFSLPARPKPEVDGIGDKKALRKRSLKHSILEKTQAAFACALKESGEAKKYLFNERRVSVEIAERFGLGFAPDSRDNQGFIVDKTLKGQFSPKLMHEAGVAGKDEAKGSYYDFMRYRITFPIRNIKGQIIGFCGRDFTGKSKSKYINTPETELYKKGSTLYGLYESLNHGDTRTRTISVVEGNLDVVTAHEFGFTDHVAACGTSLTEDHVRTLFRYADTINLVFDGDKAGRKAAWRSVKLLLPFVSAKRRVNVVMLPDGEDVDSLIRNEGGEAYEKRLKGALALSVYFLDALKDKHGSTTVEQRTSMLEEGQRLIQTAEDGNVRTLLEIELKSHLALPLPDMTSVRENMANYFRNLPEGAQKAIREVSPITLAATSAVVNRIYLSPLITDAWRNLPKHDADLVQLIIKGIAAAKENGSAPEESRNTMYRYLFLYLKERGSVMTDEEAVLALKRMNDVVVPAQHLGKSKGSASLVASGASPA